MLNHLIGLSGLVVGSLLAATTAAEDMEMPPGNLVELNYTNFDEYTREGTWMIEFYAPWCGHCKQFAPVYEKAADELKHLAYFGKIDGAQDRGLAARFDIKAFPTLFHIKDGEVRQYTGGRTSDGLKRYLEQSWKNIKPYGGLWGPDGMINRVTGTVIHTVMQVVNTHETIAAHTGIPNIAVLFGMMLAFICILSFGKIHTSKHRPYHLFQLSWFSYSDYCVGRLSWRHLKEETAVMQSGTLFSASYVTMQLCPYSVAETFWRK
eukprot:gb/GECG01006451.1/.p1 GENE.gb/GECG01006451.1/~~gb/GECG01006451.1/.p1  ORF type:complete len:264 (+),score=20.21 gb/GECG01006451.1/:1-792(+)